MWHHENAGLAIFGHFDDNDSGIDLALLSGGGATNTETIDVFPGAGTALGEHAVVSLPFASHGCTKCATRIDFDGDGRDDLAVLSDDERNLPPRVFLAALGGLGRPKNAVVLAGAFGVSLSSARFACGAGSNVVLGFGQHDPSVIHSDVYRWTDGHAELASSLSAPGIVVSDLPAASGVGDVNGDGCDDIVLAGLPSAAGAGKVAGPTAYLFLGSASTPSTMPVWQAGNGVGAVDVPLAVLGLGDVDGDGFGDVLMLSLDHVTDTTWVSVFRGSAAGLEPSPRRTAPLGLAYSRYQPVSLTLDANGDGAIDVVLPGVSGDTGDRLYLGNGRSFAGPFDGRKPDYVFAGSVQAAADVDQDGCDDVLIGRPDGLTLLSGGVIPGP